MEKEIIQQLQEMKELLKNQKTVLSFEEAAEFTGLSKSYLYKLTSKGIIPFSKPGGKKIYFDRQSLENYLLRNEVPTNAEIEKRANTIITLKKKGGKL